MPKHSVVVCTRKSSKSLPDWANGPVCILEWLHKRKVLPRLVERVRVSRQGGYCGVDVLLGLLVYFASGLKVGYRPFWETHCRMVASQLAAVAGRRGLPSSAAMSRALGVASAEEVRAFGSWLLLQVPMMEALLRHPSVLHTDTKGAGWRVFDFDHTVTAIRHRTLPPGGEERPEAKRRSRQAAGGYSGRKRGEVQFSRATLQHAGSGLWLDTRVGAGNGEPRADFEAAVQAVVQVCTTMKLPLHTAVLRADGAFGSVPYVAACQAAGLSFVSRSSRYQLLEQPEVQRWLSTTAWQVVPCSTGAMRCAAELGQVELTPGDATKRADGSSYDPVRVRMVVARSRDEDEKRPGFRRAGWRYELFIAHLDPDAWPAAEVVRFYAGRAAIENRFSQEDRALRLDHVLSYNPAGQEFACLAGLWLWNLHILAGVQLDERTLAHEATPPPPRTIIPVEPPALAEPLTEAPPEPEPPAIKEPDNALHALLTRLDWPTLLSRRPDWSFIPEDGTVRCPDGQFLVLTQVSRHTRQHPGLRFSGAPGRCRDCPLREHCNRAFDPDTPKRAQFRIEETVAAQASALLQQARQQALAERIQPRRPPRATRSPTTPRPLQVQTAGPPLHGHLSPQTPSFMPATARKLLEIACRGINTEVRLLMPPSPPPTSPLVHFGHENTRQSWARRAHRNALPTSARVRLILHGDALRHLVEASGRSGHAVSA